MSVLANQPRKTASAATPLSRVARFGIPVPPRIESFLTGPELTQYEGVRAWGLEGWSADTKMKVKWAAKRLRDLHEYVADSDFYDDDAERAKYLPLAWVGSEWNMFAVDVSNPALPVCFFESDSGFVEWAPSFDEFLKKLLRKGDKTPSEKLDAAYERATELNEAKQYAEVISLLEPVCSQFPLAKRDALDDTKETLGAAYNLVGIAYEHLGDISRAVKIYETAYELGADSAALNVCDLWLNHFKDYDRLVEYGEALREKVWAFSDSYAWFHVRNYLGQGYLLTAKPTLAVRSYHQIKDKFSVEEPAKVKQAIDELRTLIADRPQVDRAAAESILAWLDVPPLALPAAKLAAMRTWWTHLPEEVMTALREAVHVEGEPTDTDFARIAGLTELEIQRAELEELHWITMLDKLEDLDLENNALVDISPLGSLPRLRRLDISENQVETLRPLAPLVYLERLSIGENELAGLEGLEGMKRLNYLHANEAGIKSVAPLRGLPELVEVTLYQNEIDDISPMSESPRIKELSVFSNPIGTGFPSLAKLRWLESIDAGDDTTDDDVRAFLRLRPELEVDHWYPDEEEEAAATPDPELPAIRAWWNGLSPEWRKLVEGDFDDDERENPSDEQLVKFVRGEDSLHLDDKPVPGLEPLRMLTGLDYLNVGNSGTTDIAPIATLPRLRDLIIRDNPIRTLAPLVDAKVLEELYMERCKLPSFAGLEGCVALRELHAEDNLVDDLGPLAALAELRILDLEHNRLRSLAALAKLPRLHTVLVGLNQVGDLSVLAGCRELRRVEVWANPGVHNAIALIDHPELARLISHGSLPASEIAEFRRRRPDVVVD